MQMTEADTHKIRLSRTADLSAKTVRMTRRVLAEVTAMVVDDASIEEIGDEIIAALVEAIETLKLVSDLAADQLENTLETDDNDEIAAG
jgi:hypothetical protein